MCGYTESYIEGLNEMHEAELKAEQERRDEIVANYRAKTGGDTDVAGLAITYEVIEQHRLAMIELVNKAMEAGDPVNVIAYDMGDNTYSNIGTMPPARHLALVFSVMGNVGAAPDVNGVVLD